MQTRGALAGILLFLFIYLFFVNEKFLLKLKNIFAFYFYTNFIFRIKFNFNNQKTLFNKKSIIGDNEEIVNDKNLNNDKELKIGRHNRFFQADEGILVHDLWQENDMEICNKYNKK